MSFLRFAAICVTLLSASTATSTAFAEVFTRNSNSFMVEGRADKIDYQTHYRDVLDSYQVPYEVQIPYTDTEYYDETQIQCTSIPCSGNSCECKAVTVSRSRQVVRYRTETRYRTEYRVRTESYKVEVARWTKTVRVDFPADAILLAGESEAVHVNLTGTIMGQSVDVQVDSPVFGYQALAPQPYGTNGFKVELIRVPKYTGKDLTDGSIHRIELIRDSNPKLKFSDAGVVPRTSVRYEVQITDLEGSNPKEVLNFVATTGKAQEVALKQKLDPMLDYQIEIKTERDGPMVLEKPISFSVKQTSAGRLEEDKFNIQADLGELKIEGTGKDTALIFTDGSPIHSKVETEYQIQILQKEGLLPFVKRNLGVAVLKRKDLGLQTDGSFRIELTKLPGLSAKMAKRAFDKGDRLQVFLSAKRSSYKFKSKQLVLERTLRHKLK
ncbi:MAG: hypothetical protein JNL01_08760 [Bdellovibrionales bacterium]|nr:hypothetical protein [Bdellovibrionales bacterium]